MLSDQAVAAPSIGQTIDPLKGYDQSGVRLWVEDVVKGNTTERQRRGRPGRARSCGHAFADSTTTVPRWPETPRENDAARAQAQRFADRAQGVGGVSTETTKMYSVFSVCETAPTL